MVHFETRKLVETGLFETLEICWQTRKRQKKFSNSQIMLKSGIPMWEKANNVFAFVHPFSGARKIPFRRWLIA